MFHNLSTIFAMTFLKKKFCLSTKFPNDPFIVISKFLTSPLFSQNVYILFRNKCNILPLFLQNLDTSLIFIYVFCFIYVFFASPILTMMHMFIMLYTYWMPQHLLKKLLKLTDQNATLNNRLTRLQALKFNFQELLEDNIFTALACGI